MTSVKKRTIRLAAGFLVPEAIFLVAGYFIIPDRTVYILAAAGWAIVLGLLFYHALYRFVRSELQDNVFHKILQCGVSVVMLALAAAAWHSHAEGYVQNLAGRLPFLRRAAEVFVRLLPLNQDPAANVFSIETWYGPFVNIMTFSVFYLVVFTVILLLFLGIVRVLKIQVNRSLCLTLVFAVFVLSTLGAVFATDLYTTAPGRRSKIFFGGTENYIAERLESPFSFREDLELCGGFNYRYSDTGRHSCYLSQTGFFGTISKLVQTTTGYDRHEFVFAARISHALITAAVFVLLALTLKKKYGILAAGVFLAPIPFSYWIFAPGSYLIWYYFVLFLPFLTSLYFYPRVLKGEMTQRRFLLLLGLAYLLIMLRGYTYISNLVLSGAIPVLGYQLAAREKFGRIFRQAVVIGLIGVGAFVLVMALHLLQITVHLDSFQEGLDYIFGRADARISGSPQVTYPELVKTWLGVEFFNFSVLRYYPPLAALIQKIRTIGFLHAAYFGVFAAMAAVYGIARKFLAERKKDLERLRKNVLWYIAGAAAMLSSWTWLVAKSHNMKHLHMNGIMFVFPFGLTFFLLLGVSAQIVFDLLVSGGGKPDQEPGAFV